MSFWRSLELGEEEADRALDLLKNTPLYLETRDLLNCEGIRHKTFSAADLESVWEEEFAERTPERFLERRSALGTAPPGEMLYTTFIEWHGDESRWLLTAEMLNVTEMGGEGGLWQGDNMAVSPPLTLRPQERQLLAEYSLALPYLLDLPPGVYGFLFGLKRYGRKLRLKEVVEGTPPLFAGLTDVFSLRMGEGGLLPLWTGHLGSFTGNGLSAGVSLEGMLSMHFLPEYLKRREELQVLKEDELYSGMGEGGIHSRVAHVMEALRRSLPLPKIFHASRWDPLYIQKLWKIVKLMNRFQEEVSRGWFFTTAQVGLLKKATRFSIPLPVLGEWTGMAQDVLSREMERFGVGYRLRLPHEINPLLPDVSRTALLMGEGRHTVMKVSEERIEPLHRADRWSYLWEGEVLRRGDGLKVVEIRGSGTGDVQEDTSFFFTPSFRLEEYFPR